MNTVMFDYPSGDNLVAFKLKRFGGEMQIATKSWFEDREQLIADTLDFLHLLAREAPSSADRFEQTLQREIAVEPRPLPEHKAGLQTAETTELWKDIRSRVDAFQARQEELQEEREVRYENALGFLRAARARWL